MTCQWTAVTPLGTTVRLTFLDFQLDGMSNGVCLDYLELTDTASTTPQRYCGDALANTTIDLLPNSTVTFVSNHDGIGGRGFDLSYTTLTGLLTPAN